MSGSCLVLGASSFLGRCLIPTLTAAGIQSIPISRSQSQSSLNCYHQLNNQQVIVDQSPQTYTAADNPWPQGQSFISVAPLLVLPQYFHSIQASGVKKLIAVSSTSRFTKALSKNSADRHLAQRLADVEAELIHWAEMAGIDWVILRPTLIYGFGEDKNISVIASFIKRFGCFPLIGQAKGLRQPIHGLDMAKAIVAALQSEKSSNRDYNLAGAESLSYRAMVLRIFDQQQRQPRLLNLPILFAAMGLALLRAVPRYRHLSIAMLQRMNQDMVFDIKPAMEDLGFSPMGFMPSLELVSLPETNLSPDINSFLDKS